MPPPSPPIVSLEDLNLLAKTTSGLDLCHTYGIFTREESQGGAYFWVLSDETRWTGVKIKLWGPSSDYPRPLPGDIVRVHRLGFDRNILHVPVIKNARNVVVWPAFRYQTLPISIARHPTIEDQDDQRRRSLETFYCSTLDRVETFRPDANPVARFLNMAGRVDLTTSDTFNNIIVTFCDGTGSSTLRVFKNIQNHETSAHYEVATRLNVGDYFVVTNAKLDPKANKLNLSANTEYGKSLRHVEPQSILGVLLAQRLPNSDNNQHKTPENGSSQTAAAIGVRRSPRLNSQNVHSVSVASGMQNNVSREQIPVSPTGVIEEFPVYTKLSDIKKERNDRFYKFYDLVGQVRGQPNETSSYGNWVFQIFDGTRPEYASYYASEVKEKVEDCATILVFSNQKPADTSKHIDTAKTLNDSDLVLIKNVKVTWKDDKMKFELSANLEHGKSINLIDKESRFGIYLTEIVTNPIVDELLQDTPYSTPPDDDSLSKELQHP